MQGHFLISFYLQNILLPGHSPQQISPQNESDFIPSPVFGLVEISDSNDFEIMLDSIQDHFMDKFWIDFSNTHHFGNRDEEGNKNLGFPMLIALIKAKKFVHAKILLKKRPQLATVCSVGNWSPLGEIIYQNHVECIELLHLVMREGCDHNKIGTRDGVENNEMVFGLKNISPISMTNTFFPKMKEIMTFEVDYRKQQGYDKNHYCTNTCKQELDKLRKSFNRTMVVEETTDEDEGVEVDEIEDDGQRFL